MPAATAIITMTMSNAPPRMLRLLAWLSPGFPTGAYAYSHGLEWAVETGDIHDGDTLRAWLADVCALGSGRNDAILLRHAHRAARDPTALECNSPNWPPPRSPAVSAMPKRSTRAQHSCALREPGTALTLPQAVAYPVAVGALAGWHGIDENLTAAAYLQAFATNLISAAIRLVPLGQTTGLQVLAAIEPTILQVVETTATATLEDLGGCTFRADLAAMRHETQYTRLFRS